MSVKRLRSRPLRHRSRRLASLKAGQIAWVRGRVEALSPLVLAPLSGRQCIAWEARLQRGRSDLEVFLSPLRAVGERSAFALVQEADRALVLCDGALLDLAWPVDGVEQWLPTGLRAISLGANASLRDLLYPLRGKVEWEERVLLPGDEVQLRAQAFEEPGTLAHDDVSSYREAPTQLVLRAPPKRRLEIVVLEP